MQRRTFLQNAACIGACATLMSPLTDAFAGDHADASIELRLERIGADAEAATGSATLQIRATPIAIAPIEDSLRLRAWFASDSGPRAFDFASFGRSGHSQRLRFELSPQDLIGFEVASGRHLEDCSAMAACSPGLAGLTPGRYRLWLSRGGADLAAVDLQVDARAA